MPLNLTHLALLAGIAREGSAALSPSDLVEYTELWRAGLITETSPLEKMEDGTRLLCQAEITPKGDQLVNAAAQALRDEFMELEKCKKK